MDILSLRCQLNLQMVMSNRQIDMSLVFIEAVQREDLKKKNVEYKWSLKPQEGSSQVVQQVGDSVMSFLWLRTGQVTALAQV